MRRIDLDAVGERQQLAPYAFEKNFRIAVEIGPSRIPDEKGVPGEREPRLFGPSGVADEKGDAVASMAGRVENLEKNVAKNDLLAVLHTPDRKRSVYRFMKIYR